MERIKQNLEAARRDLINAQIMLTNVRSNGWTSVSMEQVVAMRHSAADRVSDLQSMASASF
jgi:hypothetical protein